MKLNELKVGETAKILNIEGNKKLKYHLIDMGLTPGVEITLRKVAPLGDPLQFILRGYELTIRMSDCEDVIVEKIDNPSESRLTDFKYTQISHPGLGEYKKIAYKDGGSNQIPEGQEIKIALAGNQNSGKTTLFNQLTGSNQHTGNFPGVTVDRKDGYIRNYPKAKITDLPGIYSLSPYSNEEIVTRDFLLNENLDCIINIVDSTNIERNLYLTMQIMELGIPMVLALNMIDELYANGGAVRVNELEDILGIPVVPIAASKNQGVDELIDHVMNVAQKKIYPRRIDFCEDSEDPHDTNGAVHRSIHAVSHLIEPYAKSKKIPLRFAATKMIESDELIENKLDLPQGQMEILNKIILEMENSGGMDRKSALANMRFSFIEKVCQNTVVKPHESKEHARSIRIDKFLTGKYTAIPFFAVIMGLIFYLTFGVIGNHLSEALGKFLDYIGSAASEFFIRAGVNPTVHSLVIDGIFKGVASVLEFLPIIVTLFFFLSILEDTGYMARVAFVMDKLLRKIGLSGRSIVPMLIGFGCTVPAILATRTLSSSRDRRMTILLTPFMSCSAKLPIYALLTGAFFTKKWAGLVMTLLYFLGIALAVLFAYILKKFKFQGEPVPFVMELPNYRLPALKNVLQLIWQRSKEFIHKAFTIVFLASLVVWFLQSFDFRLNAVSVKSESMLALIGGWIAPIFKPLGFNDWRVSTALITGFTAKESVVSTLTVLLGSTEELKTIFTPLTAITFLVFTLLYTPCVATIAVVRKELHSRKDAFLIVVFQCVVAYVVALVVSIAGKVILGLI